MYITQRVTQLNLPPPLGRTALPLLDAVLKTKEEYIMQKRAARRGTRALAFLLCLLMVVSLLPVMGASAAEGDVTAEGVKLNKSLTLATDGTYTITLEAYATGTVTSTTLQEPVPTDFVLVLDQSGSMADNIYTYTAADRKGYAYNNFGNTELYYKDGDSYYKVSTYSRSDRYYLIYTKGTGYDSTTYYLSDTGSTTNRNNASYASSRTDTIWTGVLYTRSGQTKLAALKTAVENFVTSVQNQKDLNGLPVDHRIAIVGFAQKGDGSKWGWEENLNSELFIGSDQYNYSSTDINNQYENALQQVTTTAGINNLKDSINALGAEGGTYPQLGFEMANNIFQAYRDKNDYQYTKVNGDKADRGTVVVMFTDGEPGSGGTVDTTTANATMQEAQISKNTYNAKVFTIGVFDSETNNIRTYMNAVSSNYQPNANQTPTMDNLGDEKPASDPTNYYAMADDSEALNNAFQSVSSSVNSSSTSCELDAQSVLKDVISGNLDLPDGFTAKDNVTVSTATCTGADANDNPIFGNDSPFSANVSIDGKTKTVNVSGFDYSSNYVTTGAENKGKKLIVTITGLLPNQDGTGMPSNETTSGIYDDGNLVAPFEVPTFNVASRNVVLDFSMTANIANVTGVQGNKRVSTSTYGEFTYGSNDLTYTLGKRVENGNLVFDGIDSALYYGHAYGDDNAPNAWTKVNVIPANNVYFDDDLLNVTSDFNDDDYGYDAAVESSNNQTETVQMGTIKTFTFSGTGIDVYCTTTSTSGSVFAQLRQVNDDNTTSVVSGVSDISMNDTYESGTLYNVPTISFRDLEYGTYQLKIYTDKTVDYQLDGVRVYNPANADKVDVSTAYEQDEQNATFTKVRDILIKAENFSSGQNITGAVYTDRIHKNATISDYETIGPKNEVYLANGNAIAFKVEGYQDGMKVMVGLSAPEDANSQVTMSNGTGTKKQNVQSYIDMYYAVTPNTDGCVVIENTGDSLISVTNVKVSGTADGAAATLSVDDGLLTYMASFNSLEVTEPDAEPDPTPDTTPNQTTITATINAIWNRVMNGIAKLFGRL